MIPMEMYTITDVAQVAITYSTRIAITIAMMTVILLPSRTYTLPVARIMNTNN